jgi:hypothetical protein
MPPAGVDPTARIQPAHLDVDDSGMGPLHRAGNRLGVSIERGFIGGGTTVPMPSQWRRRVDPYWQTRKEMRPLAGKGVRFAAEGKRQPSWREILRSTCAI